MEQTKTEDINYTELIALLIAICLFILSIPILLLTRQEISLDYYIGFAFFTSSLYLYLKNKKYYIIIFTLALAIGILNLYNPFILNISFKIGYFGFNFLFLALCIVFILTNKELLNKHFPQQSNPDVELKKIKERKDQKIQKFINQYQTKSRKDLEYIVEKDSGYIYEARIAAKSVLDNLDIAEN